MKQLLILFISLALFTSCDMESKKIASNHSTVYKALVANKKLWNDTQTKNYSFVVQKSCFCPYAENKQIIVDNSNVIEAKYVPSNIPISVDNKIKNIDDYFDIIEEAFNENTHKLTVNYDTVYGYPKEIFIDYDEQIENNEVSYTITHFSRTTNGHIVCTKEYRPVCASVNIQCLTQPCESIEETFPNKCMLNANPNATYLRDGEC